MSAYNGWNNYETWNVALWIGNDEGLYQIALKCRTYGGFVHVMHELDVAETRDKVRWDFHGLDTDALDEMIAEL